MLVTKVRVIAEAIDELDSEVSVDSSIVRAHQHAAGSRKTATPTAAPTAVIKGEETGSSGSSTGGGGVLQRARRTR
jgi:hypothetical protein